MSFLNQLLQTLKLELGLIKVHTFDLSPPIPTLKHERSNLNPKISNATLTCRVESIQLQSSVRVNRHLLESSSAAVKDQTLKQKEPLKESVNFTKVSSSIERASVRIDAVLKKFNPGFGIVLKSSSFSVKVKSRSVPLLRTVRFKPLIMGEDDRKRVLKTIQTYISQENLGSFSFVGFYRRVPVDCSRKMLVLDRELIVELGEKAKGVKKDLVVLLTEKGYTFLSVL